MSQADCMSSPVTGSPALLSALWVGGRKREVLVQWVDSILPQDGARQKSVTRVALPFRFRRCQQRQPRTKPNDQGHPATRTPQPASLLNNAIDRLTGYRGPWGPEAAAAAPQNKKLARATTNRTNVSRGVTKFSGRRNVPASCTGRQRTCLSLLPEQLRMGRQRSSATLRIFTRLRYTKLDCIATCAKATSTNPNNCEQPKGPASKQLRASSKMLLSLAFLLFLLLHTPSPRSPFHPQQRQSPFLGRGGDHLFERRLDARLRLERLEALWCCVYVGGWRWVGKWVDRTYYPSVD